MNRSQQSECRSVQEGCNDFDVVEVSREAACEVDYLTYSTQSLFSVMKRRRPLPRSSA